MHSKWHKRCKITVAGDGFSVKLNWLYNSPVIWLCVLLSQFKNDYFMVMYFGWIKTFLTEIHFGLNTEKLHNLVHNNSCPQMEWNIGCRYMYLAQDCTVELFHSSSIGTVSASASANNNGLFTLSSKWTLAMLSSKAFYFVQSRNKVSATASSGEAKMASILYNTYLQT